MRILAAASIALSLGACSVPLADDGIDFDVPSEGPPVALDLASGGWARSVADLRCEPIIDPGTIARFWETHSATYVVLTEASATGLVSVYDPDTQCAGECLAVCEDRWLCATLHCGPASDRDSDANDTWSEAAGSGLPTPRRGDGDGSGSGGSDSDPDPFGSPDPGANPGR